MPRSALVLAVAVALLAPAMAHAADADPAGRRLTLADAVGIASSSSPAAALAALRSREAEARVMQARGPLLPSLSGVASANDRTFNLATFGIKFPSIPGQPAFADLQGPVQDFEARIKVSQTLFSSADWMRWRAAHVGVIASAADRSASDEVAAHNAALAYLRAARAQSLVAARRADVDIAQQLVGLAESQLKAGTAPAIDVTRARTELAASRVALLAAANLLDRAGIDLARTLGLDPGTQFTLADSLVETLGTSSAPTNAAEAVSFAIAHRGEVQAEDARLRRARAERSATSAERLPRLDVAADWGSSGEHAADALLTRQATIALTIPLLDGLRREGRIAEQSALVRESEIKTHDLRDQVSADVRGSLLDLENGTEQVGLSQERLALALQELDQARERFENGVAGNIEVINAQSSLIRARDSEIDARFATAMARVNLARAAGVAVTLR